MRMRTTRLAAPIALVLAAAAAAQTPTSVVTTALEPAAEDLARLNLVAGWRLYVPITTRGDGIATVQPFDDQVFVQLFSGTVVAVQAEDNPRTFHRAGDVLWTYVPARPPGVVRPVAVGPDEVYLIHGQRLVLLDRADGKLKYSEEMVSTGQAAPAVDDFAVYIPLANRRIVAYSHTAKIPGYRPPKPYEAPDPLPRTTLAPNPAEALSTPQNRSPSIAALEILRPPFRRSVETIDSSVSIGMLRTLRPPYREIEESRSPSVGMLHNLRDVYALSSKEAPTRIKYLWELVAPGKVEDTPILSVDPADPTSERITSSAGRVIFTAGREAPRTNNISTQYVAEAEISAPLVAHGDDLYVATADRNFITLSIRELRETATAAGTLPRGKFTTGGPIEQKPLLTEQAVYAVGSRWGLIKLRHTTLDPLWTERLPDGRVRARPNPDVVRLLAVNGSYAYGLDRRGNLLVIDAVRGQTLSTFDVSGFTVPIMNEHNDRLYLAANTGLVLALHERSRVRPELLLKPPPAPKKAEEPVPPPIPEDRKAPEPKKAAEPKKGPEDKKGPEEKK
jgi:hypothetical protein